MEDLIHSIKLFIEESVLPRNPRHVQRSPISAIKLTMNKLGVPIFPSVRGPALPIREEAHEKVEACFGTWAY